MKIKHITQICVLIAAMMLLAAPSYAAYDPSLISYWKLDETSGGTAYDSTTNDNDGTISGDPTLGVTGQYGTAFDFDGDGDYIDLGSAASSSLDITGDLSISSWFKITEDPTTMKFITEIRRVTTGGNSYGYNMFVANNEKIYFRIYEGTPDLYQVISDAVSLGDWHHAVAVREGDELRIYIDGSLSNTAAGTNNPIAYHATYTGRKIAIHRDGVTNPLEGSLDDIAIWNTALNTEQVENLYSWGVEQFEASGQIPEPASMLFALAGLGFAIRQKRRRL